MMIEWLLPLFRRPRPPEIKPTEIVPGVTKPSLILIEMLVAEMLQNLDVKPTIDLTDDWYSERLEFPSFAFTVMSGRCPNITDFQLKSGVDFPIGDAERIALIRGWKKFNRLRAEKVAADLEAKKQEAAVEALAALVLGAK